MPIIIDRKVAAQFQGNWAEKPLARYVAEPFWKGKDSFIITQEGIKEIIKQSGGYGCHKKTAQYQLCSPDELSKRASDIAQKIYDSLIKSIPDGKVDTVEEAETLKTTLNDRELFLQTGGIEVNHIPSREGVLQSTVTSLCLENESSGVHDRFLNVHKFYEALRDFFVREHPWISNHYIKIQINHSELSGNKIYLALHATNNSIFGPFDRALIVELNYLERENQQIIAWRIIRQPEELQTALNACSIDSERKKVFSRQQDGVKGEGKITIDSWSGIATSEIQYDEKQKGELYTIISGIFNFILYSCNDPRKHTGLSVSAIFQHEIGTTDRRIYVKLPGLK